VIIGHLDSLNDISALFEVKFSNASTSTNFNTVLHPSATKDTRCSYYGYVTASR